ncbi:hypothetical protein TrLO_g4028 [Triparma laevis f. longispina]|uniref:J domain-containing protein n=1 Tax=Triparma laevis f. longispina TaxID=1714387 RepID=A0A9W7ECE4_9STRA|nr:hypothetical protein TrLO_g4028 [Triparma laevis f. longispina]
MKSHLLLLLLLLLTHTFTSSQDLYTRAPPSEDDDPAPNNPKSKGMHRKPPTPGASRSSSSSSSNHNPNQSAPPPPPPATKQQNAIEAEMERARLAAEARKREVENEAARLEDQQQEIMRAERRKKREAAFQTELKNMKKTERNEAIKRRKSDKKIIDRLLKSKTHYQTLNLNPKWYEFWKKEGSNVSVKQVKKAYRNLSKRIHPDKNKDVRAEDAFDMLQEANEVLSDAESKKAYDRKLELTKRSNREENLENAQDMAENAFKKTSLFMKLISKLLGPFAPSAFALCALII